MLITLSGICYAYNQIHVIKYECSKMENKSNLKQAWYVANPSYFKNILHVVERKMSLRQATPFHWHKLQIPLLQVHRASCSWAKCRPDAGKCPENMLGQFFPKYWNIGRTTIFVSSVTWFNLLNYSICSALPEMLFRRCELSRIHQNIGIQTFQLRWTCDLMRPDAADWRAQQGMLQLKRTSTAWESKHHNAATYSWIFYFNESWSVWISEIKDAIQFKK